MVSTLRPAPSVASEPNFPSLYFDGCKDAAKKATRLSLLTELSSRVSKYDEKQLAQRLAQVVGLIAEQNKISNDKALVLSSFKFDTPEWHANVKKALSNYDSDVKLLTLVLEQSLISNREWELAKAKEARSEAKVGQSQAIHDQACRETIQAKQVLANLNDREAKLNGREAKLNDREAKLNGRESQLNKQEIQVDASLANIKASKDRIEAMKQAAILRRQNAAVGAQA